MKRTVLVIVLLVGLGAVAGFGWGLPVLPVPEPSILYDINGEEIQSLTPNNQNQVDLDEISDYVEMAFIATEDRNFYNHFGIDPRAVLRATWVNIKNRRITEGGSTITQQTAKNLYLSHERTFARKIKELFYTLALERRYSKDEILTMYLNSIYFGQGATGIDAAARTYFGKPAAELSLAESALLAGIPRRPSYYDPYRYPEHAKARQKVVLRQMVELGFITEEEKKAAEEEELRYRKTGALRGDAPYFSRMVADYLVERYGAAMVYGGGLRVFSTLDLQMQRKAQEAYDAVMSGQDEELQAALVAIDPRNGHIRALIGGRDYATAPFNRAVDSKRQPGSAFKPFLYSKAIDVGLTAADMIMCEPVTFPVSGSKNYTPTDYGDEGYHYRAFTLKEALMVSDNVVSVRLNEAVGPENTAEHALKFGFAGPIKPYLSLALGTSEVSPLEMASAYGVFANGGRMVKPVAVLKVTDSDGRVLETHEPREQQVISPQNAYIITDMLTGVMQPGGTGSHLSEIIGRTSAGKTGTTQDYRDAWFVGYTPELSCAVWVGYDSPTKPVGLPGGRIAGPIWARFMGAALENTPEKKFEVPAGIVQVEIDLDTGLIATENCPRKIKAAFLAGSEPQQICYEHRQWDFWWDWNEWLDEDEAPREERSYPRRFERFFEWWKSIRW
ncbi:MAG: PBP1A family penicillin-binding protein [Syntrophomonadaceae bacterium]|nr:PBP1A family penicillin-binding protein [Syntrophomonadaceae bacterium]